ncbi:hypothetical protein D3C86_1787160 [compost metagenome]
MQVAVDAVRVVPGQQQLDAVFIARHVLLAQQLGQLLLLQLDRGLQARALLAQRLQPHAGLGLLLGKFAQAAVGVRDRLLGLGQGVGRVLAGALGLADVALELVELLLQAGALGFGLQLLLAALGGLGGGGVRRPGREQERQRQ